MEDFADHDALLIVEGVPFRNFRHAGWLQSVTDGRGRLRLVPGIRDVTLQATLPGKEAWQCGVHLAWHATRKGQTLTFRPVLGDSTERRVIARQFAEQWRTDTGRLCFRTDLERLSEMVRTDVVAPDFPSLNYRSAQQGPTASAEPAGAALQTYAVGAFPNRHRSAETLKEVLRAYGVSMSGTKEVLLEKLAKLAAEKYREHRERMDRYFQRRRFVRMQNPSKNAAAFHVVDNLPHLENLLLAVYILKHLRGSAILDAGHENDACDEEELALALVSEKVGLTGAFLQVA